MLFEAYYTNSYLLGDTLMSFQCCIHVWKYYDPKGFRFGVTPQQKWFVCKNTPKFTKYPEEKRAVNFQQRARLSHAQRAVCRSGHWSIRGALISFFKNVHLYIYFPQCTFTCISHRDRTLRHARAITFLKLRAYPLVHLWNLIF